MNSHFLSSAFLMSFMCSFMRVPNFLDVCPMYWRLHLSQATKETTPMVLQQQSLSILIISEVEVDLISFAIFAGRLLLKNLN